MKLILISILIFLLILFNLNFANNGVKITIDLGGNEFEYLEPIYFKVFIENNTNEELTIESWTNLPNFEFILKNSKKEQFNKNCIEDIQKIWKTTFYIDSQKKVCFPEGFSYYNLTDYYLIENSLPYLPEDKYALNCIAKINNKFTISETVEFKVNGPGNLKASSIFIDAYKNLSPDNYDQFILKMERILENEPKSIYHSLALDYIYMISIWGAKKYENREKIINKMINKILELPNNRYTYYKFIKNYLLLKSKRPLSEKLDILNNISNNAQNDELNKYIKIYLNNEKQNGLRKEKTKVEQVLPPLD